MAKPSEANIKNQATFFESGVESLTTHSPDVTSSKESSVSVQNVQDSKPSDRTRPASTGVDRQGGRSEHTFPTVKPVVENHKEDTKTPSSSAHPSSSDDPVTGGNTTLHPQGDSCQIMDQQNNIVCVNSLFPMDSQDWIDK